jgi:DNA replication protein DnaC
LDCEQRYKAYSEKCKAIKALRQPLNIEQQFIFDKALRGSNMFITGRAGTGKSFVLMKAYAGLLQSFSPEEVELTGNIRILS